MALRAGKIRTLEKASLVGLASAAGAALGTAMRFPHLGTAVLYPPYAIVTAALLFSPPRTWWIYLLAGSVGTFLPHRASGASVSFALMADVANYAKAIIAAWGVRRFANLRAELDTFKDMAMFLVFAAGLGPAGGAFLGAGVVALHRGGGAYWSAWSAWLLSNVMTGVSLLPSILIARARLAGDIDVTRTSPRRLLEAGALLIALLVIGALALLGRPMSDDTLAPPLYAPLPFLLWAAVRFGPGATSASLLLVTVLAITGTFAGRGPFVGHSPGDDLMWLQLFLFVTSVPLLLLSALLTERKQAGNALYASQQRYESIVEDQTDAVCRFQPDGTLTFVNLAGCQWAGRPQRELLGTSFWSLVPMDSREDRKRLLAGVTSERTIAEWEDRHERADGESTWQQWRGRALSDGRGNLVEYQAVGRDITEHKRAEDQFAALQAQRATTQALQEADRRKDEFLAVVAHELRNPLAPLALAAGILREFPSASEDENAARDIVDRQTTHLARLVDDLLDVTRITSGTIQLRSETIDLLDVVSAAIEISRPAIDAQRVRLAMEVPTEPLLMMGDGVRLAQLFSNLLNNGAKYSPPEGHLALTVARQRDEIVVSVGDEGVGIPREMLDRVFEPFMQVDRSRDGALGGLGLGLAVVKRLVELHGGTISAHSDGAGLGSEFVVRFPALPLTSFTKASRAASDSTSSLPMPRSGVGSRTVLVVDDVTDTAESLARLLRLHGHRVHVAYDGDSALRLAKETAPEIAFVDLQLPVMSGLELAWHLRRGATANRIVLVAMTGFGQLADRARTTEAGFDHHLVKPLDPTMILALLDRDTTELE
jgi:PAS domain S-box-containing protein